MSKLFYDHLVLLEEIEEIIGKKAKSHEEREELWQLIDELVHHRVIGCILEVLPEEYHHEFLERFHSCPYEEGLIGFINERIEENIEELIKSEISRLSQEIISELGEK